MKGNIEDDGTFICVACGKIREWLTHMVVLGAMPNDCDGIVAGMPYKNTGFCIICVEDDGMER